MRKILIGSILAITSIASITFADYVPGKAGLYEFTVGEYQQLGDYTYGFDAYGNVRTDDNTNGGYVAYKHNYYTNQSYYNNEVFAWKNGQMYFYSNTYGFGIKQGYIQNWCVNTNPVNCINGTYNTTTEDMLNNIGSVQTVILGNTDTTSWDASQGNARQMICFNDGTNYYCATCSNYGSCNSGLGDSLGIEGITLEDILEYEREQSPITPTTPDGRPDTEGVCMTIQDMLDRQNGTYNTGMCYSNTRYLTSTGRVTNTPKFITELYPTYTELRQDMNLYTNYCTPPADMNYCQQAFSGKEDSYTLIQKIPTTTDLTVLYDFCTTYQTRSGDLQKNICDMTEEERKNLRPSQMTQEGYAERIAKHPTTTTKPTTGTVYDDLTDEQNRDLLEAIPRVYTKITGIFKARGGYPGIIPNYITWILLLIVLFKLFKK